MVAGKNTFLFEKKAVKALKISASSNRYSSNL